MRSVQVHGHEYEPSNTAAERVFFLVFACAETPADADSRQPGGCRRQEAESVQKRRRHDRRQDHHDGMGSNAGERHVRGFRSHRDPASRDNGPATQGFARAYENGQDALQGVPHRDAAGDVRRGFRSQDIQRRETLCHGGRQESAYRPAELGSDQQGGRDFSANSANSGDEIASIIGAALRCNIMQIDIHAIPFYIVNIFILCKHF